MPPGPSAPNHDVSGTGLPRRWLLALAVLLSLGYGWLFLWSEPIHNPNEQVRIYMVRALAEHGTYAIGRRDVQPGGTWTDRGPIYDQWGYVNDKAIRCDDPAKKGPACSGWLYAGKAPGMGFLGVVPHLTLRGAFQLLGQGEPSKAWIVWWLRFSCVVVPSVLGFLWLARHLARRLEQPGLGVAVVLAAGLGSLSLTYGQMFAGHQPSGLALLLAFAGIVQAGRDGPGRWVALTGLGTAAAACIEFPAAPAGILLILWQIVRRPRLGTVGWLLLGGLLPAGLLLHFNWKAFGAPWHLPYGFLENPDFVRDIAPGVFGIHLPNKEKTVGSLFSPFTGLYFYAPWVALAWLGLAALRKRQADPTSSAVSTGFWHDRRGEALVAWAICFYFLFFQCSHSLWRGGWVVGPRYITAIVPFAALAAAYGVDSLGRSARAVTAVLLGVSAAVAMVVTGLASAVSQGFPFDVYNPLPEVVAPLLKRGWVGWNPLMWLKVPGPWSALPYFSALAAGAVWAAWLTAGVVARNFSTRLGIALLGLGLAAAWTAGLWRVDGKRTTEEKAATVRFLMQTWTPSRPPGARPLVPGEVP